MTKIRAVLFPLLLLPWLGLAEEGAVRPENRGDSGGFDGTVTPFLARNCHLCHNPQLKTGGLDLKAHTSADSLSEHPELWEKLVDKLRSGEMPPPGLPRPDPADLESAAGWIERELDRLEQFIEPDPGRVTARRLNRAEYNNTIRDLVGLDLRPADDFPQDDSGYGFDNIGDVLSMSPVLMDRYLAAAERVVRTALFGPEALQPVLVRLPPNSAKIEPVKAPLSEYDRSGLTLPNALHLTHRFPSDGDYVFRIYPKGVRPLSSLPLKLALWIDGRQAGVAEVPAHEDPPDLLEGRQSLTGKAQEIRVRVEAGDRWIAGSVLNLYDGLPAALGGPNPSPRPAPVVEDILALIEVPPNATPDQLGRVEKQRTQLRKILEDTASVLNSPGVNMMEILGPFEAPTGPSPASLRKIYTCGHLDGQHKESCAARIVSDFARRAFRRPVEPAEVRRLLALSREATERGAPLEEKLAVALQAVLVSPDFLFRIQRQSGPGDAYYPLSGTELASRLSYFLWSSMPDDELLSCGEKGLLQDPKILEAQVRRMLQDPKMGGLAENFVGQWLQIRALESAAPDRDRFPAFEEYLRRSMRSETELFFQHIVREDRSLLELLKADYTFLNERLALFYGIQGVSGPDFRKVSLSGGPRGGILTQASVLTVSSYPTRTSPVLRGKWILENILNSPPPPPPPGVPELDEAQVGESGTLRGQMEAHRSNPTCASCHVRMDPLGFGLENFNAIGAWRTMDGKFPVDASGVLPDGSSFSGPEELKEVLLRDPQAFTASLTEKLLTYALGRGLERYDKPTVQSIVSRVAQQDYRFSSLVLEIVRSLPFQHSRGIQE